VPAGTVVACTTPSTAVTVCAVAGSVVTVVITVDAVDDTAVTVVITVDAVDDTAVTVVVAVAAASVTFAASTLENEKLKNTIVATKAAPVLFALLIPKLIKSLSCLICLFVVSQCAAFAADHCFRKLLRNCFAPYSWIL
jgi:hypothetical protein